MIRVLASVSAQEGRGSAWAVAPRATAASRTRQRTVFISPSRLWKPGLVGGGYLRQLVFPAQNRRARAVNAHEEVPTGRDVDPVGLVPALLRGPEVNREPAILVQNDVAVVHDIVIGLHETVRAVDRNGPEGVVVGHLVGRRVALVGIRGAGVVDVDGILLREQAPGAGRSNMPGLFIDFTAGAHPIGFILIELLEFEFILAAQRQQAFLIPTRLGKRLTAGGIDDEFLLQAVDECQLIRIRRVHQLYALYDRNIAGVAGQFVRA